MAVVLWRGGLDWFFSARRAPAVAPVLVVSAPAPSSEPPHGVAPAAPLGTDSSISKVQLPLFLLATHPGRNTREGEALIGVNKDSPQTYAAGALLINGARLVEIYPKFVVLEKEGKFARLYLQGTKEGAAEVSDLLVVGGASAPALPEVSSREELTDYIRPSPVYDGEVLKGYVVYPGQKSGVFSRLGLRAGDVITTLNDTPLSDPQQAVALLHLLVDSTVMTATVERNGKLERMTLDGEIVSADVLAARASARQ